LVVGADLPPVRASLIKSLIQPHHSMAIGQCQDRDCLMNNCKGDRIQVEGYNQTESGSTELKLLVVHGKNDRRHQEGNYQVEIPTGLFKDLLLSHIEEGRFALEQVGFNKEACLKLFVSNAGNPFSDATFVHYWKTAMDTALGFGLPYITPTLARTVFIEDCCNHTPPQFWEGAALVMGNTVKQWRQSYNPSRKRRLVEDMTALFHNYIVEADNQGWNQA
jgi:hypothetical protein